MCGLRHVEGPQFTGVSHFGKSLEIFLQFAALGTREPHGRVNWGNISGLGLSTARAC